MQSDFMSVTTSIKYGFYSIRSLVFYHSSVYIGLPSHIDLIMNLLSCHGQHGDDHALTMLVVTSIDY